MRGRPGTNTNTYEYEIVRCIDAFRALRTRSTRSEATRAAVCVANDFTLTSGASATSRSRFLSIPSRSASAGAYVAHVIHNIEQHDYSYVPQI